MEDVVDADDHARPDPWQERIRIPPRKRGTVVESMNNNRSRVLFELSPSHRQLQSAIAHLQAAAAQASYRYHGGHTTIAVRPAGCP